METPEGPAGASRAAAGATAAGIETKAIPRLRLVDRPSPKAHHGRSFGCVCQGRCGRLTTLVPLFVTGLSIRNLRPRQTPWTQ